MYNIILLHISYYMVFIHSCVYFVLGVFQHNLLFLYADKVKPLYMNPDHGLRTIYYCCTLLK
jgi:hypothetical protein